MHGLVWFFGWNCSVPKLLVPRVVLMRADELFRKRSDRPNAIVLGDDVIVSQSPREARVAIGAHADRVIVCAPRTDPGLVVGWQMAGFTNVVTRALLTQAIDQCTTRFARPALPPSSWLPTDALADPEILAAVSVLPTLPRVCVTDWARARGGSVRSLERLTGRVCGLSPRGVLDLYEIAVTDALRRAGATLADVAESLGRSEAASVSHFLARVRPSSVGLGGADSADG